GHPFRMGVRRGRQFSSRERQRDYRQCDGVHVVGDDRNRRPEYHVDRLWHPEGPVDELAEKGRAEKRRRQHVDHQRAYRGRFGSFRLCLLGNLWAQHVTYGRTKLRYCLCIRTDDGECRVGNAGGRNERRPGGTDANWDGYTAVAQWPTESHLYGK